MNRWQGQAASRDRSESLPLLKKAPAGLPHSKIKSGISPPLHKERERLNLCARKEGLTENVSSQC
jgi:hypothetical protein